MKIYHYTKYETFMSYISPRMVLRYSEFIKTNDYSEFSKYAILPYLPENKSLIPYQEFYKKVNQFKLLCFSADSKSKYGWNLPCMWAHYGERNKGVCIELESDKIELKGSIKSRNVLYNDDIPVIDFRKDTRFFAESKEERNLVIDEYIQKDDYKILFLKESDWSIEQEYRIVGGISEEYLDISNAITGIFFGLGSHYSDEKIISLMKNLDNANRSDINIYYLKYNSKGTKRIVDYYDIRGNQDVIAMNLAIIERKKLTT